MRFRSAAHPLLILLILTGYVLSLGGLPGASVLCFSAEGHVALEFAEKKCSPSPCDDWPSDGLAGAMSDVPRTACVDIPVPFKSHDLPASNSSDEARTLARAFFPVVLFTSLDHIPPTVRIFHVYAAPPPANDSRAALRTIILLV